MHEMVFAVRDEMQVAYPELKESAERVSKVVLAEEEQFARMMELGLKQMNEETLKSGARAFRLYETFGMPLDFMVDAARDAGIPFDMEGFDAAKEEEQLGLGLLGRVGRRSRRRRFIGSCRRRSLKGIPRCGWMGRGCWRW